MKDLKVLVVDDEEEFVSALVERFTLRDIYAVGVTDGKLAVERVSEHDFNTVILDIKMPGIDGLEVLKALLSLKPKLKIFIITGYGSTDLGADGLKAGAVAYLPKPIKINNLIQMMRESLDNDGESSE
ncbi:response regulator [candidate division KSB1 bacterium]